MMQNQDPISQLTQEHDLIRSYVLRIRDILEERDIEGLAYEFSTVKKSLLSDIKNHFDLEEKVVFPAVLSVMTDASTIGLVLELVKAHGRMMRLLASLDEIFRHGGKPSHEFSGIVISMIRDLLEEFRTNSSSEIIDLFPLASSNERVKAAVCKNLEEYLRKNLKPRI